MLSYYYICHTIKYDYAFFERNLDYKKSQSIETVVKYKRALALGFTNLFEALMKKLEVKCKHIEGYCKLMPDRVKYLSYNIDNNTNNDELMNEILFKLLILKYVDYYEKVFYLGNEIMIIIEIPKGFVEFDKKYKLLNLFHKEEINELKPTLYVFKKHFIYIY